MKRRLEQLINGKFEYEHPALNVSQEYIRETLKKGENLRGEISIEAGDGRKVRGYVVSDNRRILVDKERLTGERIRLAYGVDMSGLEAGEAVEGNLTLITSIGEKVIPFHAEVEREQIQSSVGEITSPEEFVRLAHSDLREAFHIFKNPEAFASVLKNVGKKGQALYLGMSRNPVTYQHLEEYLIGAGLKEPVTLKLERQSAEYFEIRESMEEELEIRKSGWGHLELEVETEGDFLKVSKKTVGEEDFIGSIYRLRFLILKGSLKKGKNFGVIRLKSPYQELIYKVVASREKEVSVQAGAVEKKCRVSLMKDYLALRTHKMDYKLWAAHTREILDELERTGRDYPEYQMYLAYFLNQEERTGEAVEILKKYRKKTFTRAELECAGVYLYLCYTTGYLKDAYQIGRKIHSFYLQQENSFLLFWLWTQMDEELQNSPQKLAFAMEEQYRKGSRSPLLYLEAWELITKDLNLLRRVGGLWTQVFRYAGAEGLLTEEACMRLAYLSGYEKQFSNSLMMALSYAYEAFPGDDILEAICKYIMKGNPRNTKYFKWFSMAVERGLRITRLYEYYMETVDISYQRELPKTLLMYFAYNNSSLSDGRRAYLFANIIANKEKMPQIYNSYRRCMEMFAAQMLEKNRINEDYAVLYQELCMNPENQEEGRAIGGMLYTYRLYCEDEKIRSVIVRNSQMDQEEVFSCIHGVAYPRIYTEDCVILFQDDRKRRYAATVDYNLRKLLDEEQTAEKCLRFGNAQAGLLLCECEKQSVSAQSLGFFEILAGLPDFSEEYKRRIRKELLMYYSAHIQEEQVEESLQKLDWRQFLSVDKKLLLELLIEGGLYAKAYEVIGEYGCEKVDPGALLKLVSRLILQKEMEADEELFLLAEETYRRGKFNEVLLTYLMKYERGPAELLLKLWKSARSFRLDTFDLEERILETLMFTWNYTVRGGEVFRNYVRQTGKENVIIAYLIFVSYGEFVYGIHPNSFMRKSLETACTRKWDVNLVCRLNFLKNLSEKQEFSRSEEALISEILTECEEKKLAFSFFRELPSRFLGPCQMEDKTFVEYQTNPKARVTLYYELDAGLGAGAEYKSEPLKNTYEGFFVKAFTLFYGEQLRYYFSVEKDGKKEKTPVQTIVMDRTEDAGQSKFQFLNRALSAWKHSEKEEAAELLREYLRQEQYMKYMYTIEKEP